MVFVLILAMVWANFSWQALRDKDYEKAFERSYFQTIAALVLVIYYHS